MRQAQQREIPSSDHMKFTILTRDSVFHTVKYGAVAMPGNLVIKCLKT